MGRYSNITDNYKSDELGKALEELAKGMGKTVPAPLPYPPPVPRELRGTVRPAVEIRAPKHGTSGKTDPGGLGEPQRGLPDVLAPVSTRLADELEHLIGEHYSSRRMPTAHELPLGSDNSSRKLVAAPIISELPSEAPEITIVEEVILSEDFGNVMPLSQPTPVKLAVSPLATLTEKELRVAVLARLPKAADRAVFEKLATDCQDSKAFRILCEVYLLG